MIDIHREPAGGEDHSRRVLELVRHQGWAVEYLGGRADARPAVTSTFGLSLRGHPEFVVLGCAAVEGFLLLEPLANAVEAGRRFDETDDVTDLLPGPEEFELVRLPDSTRYLPTVNALFRRTGTAPIPALRLARPDQADRRPASGLCPDLPGGIWPSDDGGWFCRRVKR